MHLQDLAVYSDHCISLGFCTVWEVHFHPTNPDHLFTCSEDGSLLHWETASQSDMPSFLQGKLMCLVPKLVSILINNELKQELNITHKKL